MRIGLLGGMFDPVHIGHLRPAMELLERLGLDEVRLVPCADPAHRGSPFLPAEQRVALLEAAVMDIPGLAVDARELDLPKPSYTVQTLQNLHSELPGAAFVLAMGEDAFEGFCRWKDWRTILELCDVVVLHRPGELGERDPELSEEFAARQVTLETLQKEPGCGRMASLPVTPLAISSTELRERLATGGDPRYLVPDSVRRLIIDNDFYRTR